ncbi:hypothetical protein K1719_008949 [Acacia pycnantha]|nr:hypothetical protein K1719_008949 [Acacia pycnantha]
MMAVLLIKFHSYLRMQLISSDAFYTEQLLGVMDKLKHGQAVDIPNYDFKSYKGMHFQLDGTMLLVHRESIKCVWRDNGRNRVWAWFLMGSDIVICLKEVLSLHLLSPYSKFEKPAFDDFILPTKKYADIIIPRGGNNHVAIDLSCSILLLTL